MRVHLTYHSDRNRNEVVYAYISGLALTARDEPREILRDPDRKERHRGEKTRTRINTLLSVYPARPQHGEALCTYGT